MADDVGIYDLGEVREESFEAILGGAGNSRRAAATVREAAPPADDRSPLVAASLSVVVPGSGQLAFGDGASGLLFLSLAGLAVSSAWAIVTTWDRLVPTLAVLEIPSWTATAALVAAFVLAAGAHLGSAVHAHAHRSTGRDAATHPIVAGLGSMLIPGWGQLLAGNRGRAGFFLGAFWLLGGAWLAVTPWVSARLAETGLGLPREILDGTGPVILLAATGVIWALAVYDAAAGAHSRR
jgi:TM2 domain-containing membrane protein YozV